MQASTNDPCLQSQFGQGPDLRHPLGIPAQ